MTQPGPKTIRKMVDFFQSMGLSVYGPCASIQGKTRYHDFGMRDYSAEDIIALKRWLKRPSDNRVEIEPQP